MFKEQFYTLIEYIQSGVSDRELALLFASYCETFVAELIETKLVGLPEKARVSLFRKFRTASDRYALARDLELVERNMYDDLMTLARIRNKFAHDLTIKDITSNSEFDRINKIGLSPNEHGPSLTPDFWSDLSPRIRFEFMCIVLGQSLHNRLNRLV